MTDIVERLRSVDAPKYLMWEAADVIERLTAELEADMGLREELARLRAENEQLKAYAKHERSLGAEGPMIELVSARQEIEQLKAALKPFALNVDAVSLCAALGHIMREDLLRARAALEPKP